MRSPRGSGVARLGTSPMPGITEQHLPDQVYHLQGQEGGRRDELLEATGFLSPSLRLSLLLCEMGLPVPPP